MLITSGTKMLKIMDKSVVQTETAVAIEYG